jgi:hypothetical protein
MQVRTVQGEELELSTVKVETKAALGAAVAVKPEKLLAEREHAAQAPVSSGAVQSAEAHTHAIAATLEALAAHRLDTAAKVDEIWKRASRPADAAPGTESGH